MWYLLNFIPSPGVKRNALPGMVDAFNAALPVSERLELFAPMFVSVTTEDGKVSQSERPLLYHYIFVRGGEGTVKLFCRSFSGLSFVLDRAGASRYLTVSDEAIEQFRIIARFYGNRLPCYPLEGISLEEGDKVQIVSGPCAGLTGTFISRKGAKTGNILVAVDTTLAAIVYDVKADYVRVLEFSKDSRRVYDQIDAFSVKLLGSDSHVPAASIFTRRLGALKLDNPKLEAKLKALLFVAYSILGDKANADIALAEYEKSRSYITNPATKALILYLMAKYGAFPDSRAMLEEARTLMETLESGKTSRIQQLLLQALS